MQNDKRTGSNAKYNNKTALEYAEMEGKTEAAQVIRAGTLATTHACNISHTYIYRLISATQYACD
jgi:hypothetical protein